MENSYAFQFECTVIWKYRERRGVDKIKISNEYSKVLLLFQVSSLVNDYSILLTQRVRSLLLRFFLKSVHKKENEFKIDSRNPSYFLASRFKACNKIF